MKEGYRPYLEDVEEVFAEAASKDEGLSGAEATKRLETDGPNKLIEAMTKDVSDLKEDNKHKRSKRDSTQKCPYCNKQWNFNRVRRKQYNTKEGLIITCSKCGEKFKVMARNINKDEGQKPRYEFYGVALKDLE